MLYSGLSLSLLMSFYRAIVLIERGNYLAKDFYLQLLPLFFFLAKKEVCLSSLLIQLEGDPAALQDLLLLQPRL